MPEPLRLVYQILDRELIDSDFVPCGKIDDIELDGEPGQELFVRALLVGPGAFGPRIPAWLRILVFRVRGTFSHRIPWSEIKSVGSHIQLRSTALVLDMNASDRRLARTLRRLPGGS